jgi:tyrosine phenol-lyase
MPHVKLFSGENLPLEMHKVRIVQKLDLVPIERRSKAFAKPATTRSC